MTDLQGWTGLECRGRKAGTFRALSSLEDVQSAGCTWWNKRIAADKTSMCAQSVYSTQFEQLVVIRRDLKKPETLPNFWRRPGKLQELFHQGSGRLIAIPPLVVAKTALKRVERAWKIQVPLTLVANEVVETGWYRTPSCTFGRR